MAITHKILTDEDGNPVAAQIPWEEFEILQAELEREDPLSKEQRMVLERRFEELKSGEIEGISTEAFFTRARERCASMQSE